ncbi:hypothetical protein [Paraflavitalea speifideaquila]|uniref:hypothetical protein n=1 Tax=Paraflavitalea speifideaquila TaxID=3076558 RepID=UPI003313012C
MAATGAAYSVGMDSRHDTGEEQAPEKANDIIQDLTYVAILKDYGKSANKTIPRPEGYNAAEFNCACDVSDPASFDSPQNNCYRMIQYGRLPGNKYMINWPKCGNDIYLHLVEKHQPKESCYYTRPNCIPCVLFITCKPDWVIRTWAWPMMNSLPGINCP